MKEWQKGMNRQYLGFEISKEVYNNSIIKNAII